MTSGGFIILGAIISVLGLFVYGFITWILKRLIAELDALVTITGNLHSEVKTLSLRVRFLENKLYGTSTLHPPGENDD